MTCTQGVGGLHDDTRSSEHPLLIPDSTGNGSSGLSLEMTLSFGLNLEI
jgi:hypothetical protein